MSRQSRIVVLFRQKILVHFGFQIGYLRIVLRLAKRNRVMQFLNTILSRIIDNANTNIGKQNNDLNK